jgi:lysophospholipase L1-like esterase
VSLTYSRVRYEHDIRLHPGWPRLISEGDSWFSYPLAANLVRQIERIEPKINLLRLEHSGDDVLDIIADRGTGNALDEGPIGGKIGYQEQRLRGLLGRAQTRPHVLLFSAGGNDIIGPELFEYLKPYATYRHAVPAGSVEAPEHAIYGGRFDGALDRIEAAYQHLIGLRDQAAPACRIVTHTYCAPQPRPVVGPFDTGPWMYPAFLERGYPKREAPLMRAVIAHMIARFAQRLTALASIPGARGFHVVDLTGPHALAPAPFEAPARSGDWSDEIHPNDRGFAKLARHFRPVLRSVFPGTAF